MGAIYTEAQKRATNKYYADKDVIRICCPKGKRAEIQKYAKSKGKTLTAFINEALDQAMKV